MDKFENRIESTKMLIHRDKLVIPGNYEEELVRFVLSFLLNNKYPTIFSTKPSTYDIEFSKVLSNLQYYFEDDEILKSYHDIIINRGIINQCLSPHEYFTTFNGPQMAWALNIPKELDELSHIFIGHEVMHILATHKNPEEWKYLLLYSEIIPLLYELIQADNENDEKRNSIINFRYYKMLEMYNSAYSNEVLDRLENDKMSLKYYQMQENIYFISFYYTIVVYALYKQDPQEILSIIKKVLKQELTTLNMLKQLNIVRYLQPKLFKEGTEYVLKLTKK